MQMINGREQFSSNGTKTEGLVRSYVILRKVDIKWFARFLYITKDPSQKYQKKLAEQLFSKSRDLFFQAIIATAQHASRCVGS